MFGIVLSRITKSCFHFRLFPPFPPPAPTLMASVYWLWICWRFISLVGWRRDFACFPPRVWPPDCSWQQLRHCCVAFHDAVYLSVCLLLGCLIVVPCQHTLEEDSWLHGLCVTLSIHHCWKATYSFHPKSSHMPHSSHAFSIRHHKSQFCQACARFNSESVWLDPMWLQSFPPNGPVKPSL